MSSTVPRGATGAAVRRQSAFGQHSGRISGPFSLKTLRRLSIEHWAFLAFFPGYVLYQALIVQGVASPVFGAVSTPIVAFFLLPLIVTMIWRMMRGSIKLVNLDWLYFAFVTGFLIQAFIGYSSYPKSLNAVTHFPGIAHLFAYYIAVRQMKLNDPRTKFTFIISFAVIVTIILSFVDDRSLSSSFFDRDERFYRDYQGYALALVVTTFGSIATISRVHNRAIIYVFALTAFVVNGARSELFAVIPALIWAELLMSRSKSAGLFVIGSVITLSVILLPYLRGFGDTWRVLNLAGDYHNDGSYIARVWSIDNAWKTIARSPILGDYGSYPVGTYAHNILSAWVDLGLGGLLIYLSLLSSPIYLLWSSRASSRRREVVAVSMLGLAMIILSLGSKVYFYNLIAPMVAMTCVVASQAKSDRSVVMTTRQAGLKHKLWSKASGDLIESRGILKGHGL